MARESVVEGELVKAVRRAGGLCIKLPAFLYRGIPDRLVLLPGGLVIFVEMKDHKGRTMLAVRFHQERFRDRLLALGLKWYKIKGRSDLQDFINKYLGDPLC